MKACILKQAEYIHLCSLSEDKKGGCLEEDLVVMVSLFQYFIISVVSEFSITNVCLFPYRHSFIIYITFIIFKISELDPNLIFVEAAVGFWEREESIHEKVGSTYFLCPLDCSDINCSFILYILSF